MGGGGWDSLCVLWGYLSAAEILERNDVCSGMRRLLIIIDVDTEYRTAHYDEAEGTQ